MIRLTYQSLLVLVVLTVLTGGLYPLLVTGTALVAFPHQANGSLIERDGRAVGSELIGQPFVNPRHFWGRPSATAPVPYNGASSGGSNLGPTNPDLGKQVAERVAALRAADPGNARPAPVDLVTASGSGLDPDISPAAAEYQAPRVSKATGLSEQAIRDLIPGHSNPRSLGLFGEPRVNVLELNMALDALAR